MNRSPLKEILVVGPGGLGGTVAAMLASSDSCRVRILGRPGIHIDTIRQRGIHLTGLRDLSVPLEIADGADSVGECDVIIYATKAQHTPAALARTVGIKVRQFVTSIQNGVIKDDELAASFGRDKVVGAVAMIAAERTVPGDISFNYDGGTFIGELDGGSSERVESFVALCKEGGLVATGVDDIVAASWTKMVGWIPVGMLASLTRCDNATILSNELLATEFVGALRELNALAVAKGIELTDIGPYSSRTWCDAEIDEAIKGVMSSPLTASQTTHSALQDVTKGLATEFEACVRPMIDEASRLGIPLQRTKLLYAALMGLEASLQTSREGE
jgi:2-dehydropantoate 2-reductase